MGSVIQIKGVDGGRDRRHLFSLTYNYLMQGVSDIEALTMELPNVPPLPEVGDRKINEWRSNNDFMVKVLFEGVVSDPTDEQDQFLIQGEEREEPIEAFPNREALETEGGAYEDPDSGRLKFPETWEPTGGPKRKKGAKPEKNPFFGLTTYPMGRWVASRSYVRRTVPASVYSGIWEVTNSLPSGFDQPPDTTWIKIHPLIRKRGNCSEIIERYKDLSKLAHLEALYLLLGKR